MKEIRNIIIAYKRAVAQHLKCAIATVVKVEGSSYRQPGARMLITEEGMLTGAISGGCLEGDALKKALLTIHQKVNKLITYDTSNPQDSVFGVQLGCNGIVHILFEYIDPANSSNPIVLLEKLVDRRDASILVTIFSLEKKLPQLGTRIIYQEGQYYPFNLKSDIDDTLREKIELSYRLKKSIITTTNFNNSSQDILIEYISVTISIVIVGAGNDALPLVNLANIMGWKITIIDGRRSHANSQRFPLVDDIIIANAEDIKKRVDIDENTAVILMTHNYKYDRDALSLLLNSASPYIGSLGPKTKLNRMLSELKKEGVDITMEHTRKIFGPVGLDIGAETSEEIALSIVSEISAVFKDKNGKSLKFREQNIHKPLLELKQ